MAAESSTGFKDLFQEGDEVHAFQLYQGNDTTPPDSLTSFKTEEM